MEPYDNWFLEQGFVGGITRTHNPLSWHSMSYAKGTKIINGGWAVGEHHRWWAYTGSYMTPVFDTPWAALAYANLENWGRGEPAFQGELELLVDGAWQQMGVDVRMYPGEPVNVQLPEGAVIGQVTAARAGAFFANLSSSKTLDAHTTFTINLTCGIN